MLKSYDLTGIERVRIAFQPRPAQKLILDALDRFRFVVAVCHRRLGKTLCSLAWLSREALTCPLNNFRGYFFAPTQKQAKLTAWEPLKLILAPLKEAGLVDWNETELRVDFPNGAKIFLGSGEAIENYRGIYIDRAVLDELASWANSDYAYNEVLRPAMADRAALCLIIGTVRGLDRFHEFYQRGLDPSLPTWTALNLPASITGILPESELVELRMTMTADAYAREFENDWYAEAPDVLITPREVKDAINRIVMPDIIAASPKVIGIDVGNTGDPSVATIRQGPMVYDPIEWQVGNMQVADNVSRLINLHRPQSVFIDAGEGAGVISRLEQLGKSDVVVPVWFGSSSPAQNCFNRRAFMFYNTKKFLVFGSIPNHYRLIQDLTNQYIVPDPSHRVRLLDKKKIKDILGRSPDFGDSLALTFADGEFDMLEAKDLLRLSRLGLSAQDLDRLSSIKEGNEAYNPMTYMEKLYEQCDDISFL